MELTVYRQSSKQRPDGTIVYKGEDARPFVDDRIFFVADGLGGAAAIRHQQVKPELFEKEKLLDTLFKGVYESYDDERFVQYVTDSFFELFAVKDCYTDNVNNIKKSGYFASRIVTAIVLHEMIYDESLNPAVLFEQLHAAGTPEQQSELLTALGDRMAARIRDDIRKIAQNANLIYESSYSGLALLGSTLCATIYQETETGVETLYLTAGDSRPYVWTENDGLCQIIEDQEGKDGGMTNYIKANEDETFGIRCNYYRFPKPCVLFDASDGCFDSGYFLSQMAFEKLILEKGIAAADPAAMGESIYETFLTYGKHDDSSTIAMKFFGYDSFGAFQESAGRRLEVIGKTYIEKLPDLLEHDYVAEYAEKARKSSPGLSELKPAFETQEAVMAYCAEQMKTAKYAPYESALREIDKKIDDAKGQIARETRRIRENIGRNYIKFQGFQKSKLGELLAGSRIQDIDAKYGKLTEEFRALVAGLQADFAKASAQTGQLLSQVAAVGIPADYSDYDGIQTGQLLSQVAAVGIPADYSDYDGIDLSAVESCEGAMHQAAGFLGEIRKKRQSIVSKLAQLRLEYEEQNKKLAAKDEEDYRKICDMVLSGDIDPDVVRGGLFEEDCDEIKALLSGIRDVKKQIAGLEKEEREKALLESRNAYWEDRYAVLIEALIADPAVTIPEDLRAQAAKILAERDSQTGELKEKAQLQAQLFAQYDVVYGKYMAAEAEAGEQPAEVTEEQPGEATEEQPAGTAETQTAVE